MADTTTPGVDTYATQAELTAYFATRLGTDAWDTATEGNRIKAALMACNNIELLAPFRGYPAALSQALNWPRQYVFDPRGMEYAREAYPAPLIQAQAEEALTLLQTMTSANVLGDTAAAVDRARGITQIGIHRSTITYGGKLTLYGGALKSPDAYTLMRPLMATSPFNGIDGLQNETQERNSIPPPLALVPKP
jgi:hypothetical protein